MAENPTADPFSPSIEPSLFYPDLLDQDRCFLQEDFGSEFGLDLDIEWDDLLLSDYPGDVSPQFDPSCDESPPQISAVSSSSTGNMNLRSPESDHSVNYSADCRVNPTIKRKNGRDEEIDEFRVHPSKFRRGEEMSSCVFNAGGDEEEKKNARLMRNRESAQLSRQRKKQYVDELEEKVRSMNSTIVELNNKISFFMNENANLRQQLGGNGIGSCQVAPGVSPVHFPWIPFPGIAFRPQGSPVALIPIPKLKLQKSVCGGNVMKSERKKGGRKTKKVASVSLLGFLFVMLICRCLVPRIQFVFYGSSELVGLGHGRILSVSGSLNYSNEIGLKDAKGLGEDGHNRMKNRSSDGGKMEFDEKSLPFDDNSYSKNSSETLPAFLYVSRDGKLVKISGNLIINSVLASEEAVVQAKFRNQATKSAAKESKETSFEVRGSLASALALSNSGNGVNMHSKSHGSSAEHKRALASDSEDQSKDKTQDAPLQQWFLEGLAGPIFSSGTCTEVFQFEISPPSVEPSGVIPAPSSSNSTKTSINATENLAGSSSSSASSHSGTKNRRFLYPRAIPLTGSTLNHSEHLGKATESNGFSSSASSAASMVVSILADPREAGDGADVDEIISTKKSISRIFVVVLLDSVKYVTYSCVLPLMSPAPHLVN